MSVKRIGVVGSGLMGAGIAQCCAQAGMDVVLTDTSEAALSKGMKSIEWSVSKLAEKGKLTRGVSEIMDSIGPATDLEALAEVELVVEAVYENLELKQEIFAALDRICASDTLLSTNTSAIPITELGAVTQRPESVIGLHFFSPVPMMPVVEVVKGIATSQAAVDTCMDFARAMGKTPVRVERDVPGFLLNRINLISYVEAIRLLESGIGTVEEIDAGVRLGFGRRMGPFETGDMVGLDVSFGALTAIYNESKDGRYYPPQMLRRKVKAGQLGRKTGKGWYSYGEDNARGEVKS
ncbi:MAG: 3-hydroxyacyl-CoA dehydrogenase family protein [Desulfobacterales bacterium]|nr:3-hydroxyacyl-CoA dehydrogenase family protein [Desulfobacterales bacterium]